MELRIFIVSNIPIKLNERWSYVGKDKIYNKTGRKNNLNIIYGTLASNSYWRGFNILVMSRRTIIVSIRIKSIITPGQDYNGVTPATLPMTAAISELFFWFHLQIETNMIVVRFFFLNMNQPEFRLAHNQKENSRQVHIPFNLNWIRKIFIQVCLVNMIRLPACVLRISTLIM